ncbi:MAG TPA: DUF2493 domain-containing protein [Rhodospirillales bacterium]|nr:DUF2493 domain-containing protein [Rhodospirillales bacterium]
MHSRTSPTARALQHLALGGRRSADELDSRPLPDPEEAGGELAGMFHALEAIVGETWLEPDLEALQWGLVNLFHRQVERVERVLDRNEQAQQASQREQDGSEVKSVALERLLAEGIALVEARHAYEAMRDVMAELFTQATGRPWAPRSGSKTSTHGRAVTAAVIDSRDFVRANAAERRETTIPDGTRIIVSGGDCQAHDLIWSVLDRALAKHPDMVLLHGGTPKGVELIAAKWAEHRRVPQVVFKPDWTRHRKAAPFKRNDAMLATEPAGVIAFPGTGITGNLVDKAKAKRIPVKQYGAP